MITPIFHVGQEIVCVNAEFAILLAQDPRIQVPVKGRHYHVRKNYQLLHAVGITLAELDNSHAIPKGRKLEPNFHQERFIAVPEVTTQVLEEEVSHADAI